MTVSIEKYQSQILQFLSEFIKQSSESPKEAKAEVKKCMKWLEEKLNSWGWEAFIKTWEIAPDEANIAIRLPGKSGKTNLMFNGHADVVPVLKKDIKQWEYPPYGGIIKDGKVWGRGSSDMKGGITSFLWAAKLLWDSKEELEHDLLLTINIGEESARPEIGSKSIIDKGFEAPFVINAEPTALNLARIGLGWFFFKIGVEGKSTHPANSYLCYDKNTPIEKRPGVDAINKLRFIMNKLDKLNKSWYNLSDGILPKGSMNMTCVQITGGEKAAKMADFASATYAVLYHPDYSSEQVLDEIKDTIMRITKNDPWLSIHLPEIKAPVIDPIWEPFELPEEHSGVKQLIEVIEKVRGGKVTTTFFRGPCDANIFSEAGLNTVIYGPGDLSYGAHGVNEYVPIGHIFEAIKVYVGIIKRRCALDG